MVESVLVVTRLPITAINYSREFVPPVNFLKKNEITIPRLPPKATEPTYEL